VPNAPAQTGAKPGQQQQAQQRPQVFRVGVYETDTPDIDITLAATAANWVQQKLGTFKISPNGWLAGIWCLFQMSVTGNSTNVVTFTGDSPFSSIFKVTFRDVGNREIFGPLTGYEWFTVNKWGGYFPGNPDPRGPSNGFSTVGGAVATGGSFQFLLFMPLEIVYRDSLGEIENKSSSSAYTLEIYVDTLANTYYGAAASAGVAPLGTATLSMRMRGNLIGYTEPESTDSSGRPLAQQPPAAGTVQYWASETFVATTGTQKYNQQNGIGYSIRNLAYIAYDNANGSRASGYNYTYAAAGGQFTGGDFPDPSTLAFGKVQLYQRPIQMWANLMSRWFGLFITGGDVANGLENGVFVQAFNREFDTLAGNELRNGYLVTKAGNVLQHSGTYTGPANVHFLTNYIVPPGNDAARLRSSR
jgi:hypothetical protein